MLESKNYRQAEIYLSESLNLKSSVLVKNLLEFCYQKINLSDEEGQSLLPSAANEPKTLTGLS